MTIKQMMTITVILKQKNEISFQNPTITAILNLRAALRLRYIYI
jgi:hypothetical protein